MMKRISTSTPILALLLLATSVHVHAGVRPQPVHVHVEHSQPLVNINTATVQQLAYLPGIGKRLAQRISDYRALHGAFVRVADLRLVPGFGDGGGSGSGKREGRGKRLAKVSPYAMVSGLTTATGKIRRTR